MSENLPRLCIVIPCYNEQEVLPITSGEFLEEVELLISKNKISPDSKIMFVDDGSRDDTWNIILNLSKKSGKFIGIRQSRNRGHQNAVWAGLMEARELCDITISIDCDGQDDIAAIENMVDEYLEGCEIVYGVRNDRSSDTWFKRNTAQGFYKFMSRLGVDTVYNHADYRLISTRAVRELEKFDEANIFLRGMVPLVGFKSSCVYYERHERIAGESKYPLKKMLALAVDGITSLSIKPLRIISGLGTLVAIISFIGVIWSVIRYFMGQTISGWTSMTCIICFLGGVQLICMGILGEYIGKIYLETKRRPKYIISDRTY